MIEKLSRQAAALEQRINALEQRVYATEAEVAAKEADLVDQYGKYVDKTEAARILGVTRATVYAMLADGRLTGAFEGKRVSVRSIASYMTRKTRSRKAT